MHDVYELRRDDLAELTRPIQLHDGQCGAMVLIAGRFAVLDLVSRPDAFALLHGPLLQGYGLDALAAESAELPSSDEIERLLESITNARAAERDGIGLGRDLRFEAGEIVGSGLIAGEELIQLTAFGDEATAANGLFPRGSVGRPGGDNRVTLRAATAVDLTAIAVAQTIN